MEESPPRAARSDTNGSPRTVDPPPFRYRYYAYCLTRNNGLFVPVGILYLQERGLGLDAVGFTQGAFLVALVAFQLPSGYLSDRLGHRTTLVIGCVVVSLAMACYPLAGSVSTFTALFVAWAFGWACRTGAGEAWLYEALDERDAAASYARIDGRGATVELLGSAGAAALAGVLFAIDPALPFVGNAVLTALGIPVLLSLPATTSTGSFSVDAAAGSLVAQLSRPDVRWFVGYLALFYALFEVTRAFEQPAASEVGVSVTAIGLMYAAFKLVSACGAYASGAVADRFGPRAVFGVQIPIVGVAYASIWLVPQLVIVVFFLTRTAQSLTRPIQNQYVNDRFDADGRATALSGISMATALAGAVSQFAGGLVAVRTGAVTLLLVAGVGLSIAIATLWVAATPVRPAEPHRTAGSGPRAE
ncbi:MFS transporter [Halovivax gelatinilyticus]|uniref:MFS transporter n=1 Tax=Halovivax gelatinilyticus TaxID=2961597 RepID=UPI0020CA4C00|nr:MFS transporter [Halovivax gelatinilyticus]